METLNFAFDPIILRTLRIDPLILPYIGGAYAFVQNNPITIGAALAALKLIAKKTPWVEDDKIVTLIQKALTGGWRAGITDKGKANG